MNRLPEGRSQNKAKTFHRLRSGSHGTLVTLFKKLSGNGANFLEIYFRRVPLLWTDGQLRNRMRNGPVIAHILATVRLSASD